MRKIIIFLLLTLAITAHAQKVKIAAAADLRYAMDEIVKAYKVLKPNSVVDVVYGSSGNAFTQISNGAPFDVYFSADIIYPRKLQEAGYTLTEPKLYAIGRLVIWSATKDVSKGLPALTYKSNIKIAIANPEHAPYGQRSIEALKYFKLHDKVQKQLIYGENIAQAAQFCLTGNADIGLLALSLALSPAMKSHGNYYLIDEESYTPLEQAYVVLTNAKGNTEVFDFVGFIAKTPSRAIFEKYGFIIPK